MSPRATWKGYLKLSLVSCPIALYPATSSDARVKFRQINLDTGNRIKQQLVDSVTGAVVESEKKGKGYEIGKDEYLIVDDAELETLQVESSRTIEIDTFVPRDQIDPRFLDSPYYITPDGKVGQDAFAVIREAMRGKEMVGIGRVVLSSRERPIMLESFGKGLRAVTLRYPYEVRAEDAYFEDIADVKVSGELLDLAATILDSKTADFDPAVFVDRYEDAVVEMLNRKKAGQPPLKPIEKKESNVVNLMDALRASVKVDGEKPKASKTPAAKTSKAPARKTKAA
jgi:DNA end-binding protein Ku